MVSPAITACEVGQCDDYPTHRPLKIEVNVKQLEKVIRELHKTTGYAKLLEEKIQGKIQEERANVEAEEEHEE